MTTLGAWLRATPTAARTLRPARDVAWRAIAALGAAAVAAYFLLPPDVQGPLYQAIGVLSAMVVLGVAVATPSRRRLPWLTLGVGLALYVAGDIVYYLLLATGDEVPFPSAADAAYLVGQVLIVAGLAVLTAPRERGWYRPALLDGLLLAVAFGLVLWLVEFGDVAAAATSAVAVAIGWAYPMLDLGLVAVLAGFLITRSTKAPAAVLLLAGCLGWLASDLAFLVQTADGSYVDGSLVDLGWLAGYVLCAIAAVHPSSRSLGDERARSGDHISNRRLVGLAVSMGTSGAAIAAHALSTEPDPRGWTGAAEAVLIGLFALVGIPRFLGALHRARSLLEESRVLERELEQRARSDALTSLPNRTVMHRRLGAAIAAGHGVGLVVIDLDDFKAVNDSWGHATGDELLRVVGERLRGVMRDVDDVARLGGDEFTLVIAPCASAAVATAVVERALRALEEPVALRAHTMRVHPSAGVAWSIDPGVTGEALLQQADLAMYAAKSRGGNGWAPFTPDLQQAVVERLSLRSDLEEALSRDELQVAYQPVVALGSREVVAVEALARWTHPVHGSVSPATFVRIAEQAGFSDRLAEAVLRKAATQLGDWDRAGARPVAMHVNLAPQDVTSGAIVTTLERVLAATGTDPHRIVLELTETALIDVDAVRPTLDRLKALGVRIALDDFGSRYAVIASLGELPLDIVKLDRSLTARIGAGAGGRLVAGVVRLAQSLGLDAVAEGVEDEATASALASAGCPFAQGYAFGRPGPAPELAGLIRAA